MPADRHLPYAYPPLIALAFRPFAHLPFAASYAAWLVASAALYAGAVALAIRAAGTLGREDRATAWLVALA